MPQAGASAVVFCCKHRNRSPPPPAMPLQNFCKSVVQVCSAAARSCRRSLRLARHGAETLARFASRHCRLPRPPEALPQNFRISLRQAPRQPPRVSFGTAAAGRLAPGLVWSGCGDACCASTAAKGVSAMQMVRTNKLRDLKTRSTMNVSHGLFGQRRAMPKSRGTTRRFTSSAGDPATRSIEFIVCRASLAKRRGKRATAGLGASQNKAPFPRPHLPCKPGRHRLASVPWWSHARDGRTRQAVILGLLACPHVPDPIRHRTLRPALRCWRLCLRRP